MVLTSQNNAITTRALFELWATTVFFSTIDQRHRDLGHLSKALLFVDGLRSHHTKQFLAKCPVRDIEVLFLFLFLFLFLIAHLFDQLQPLDLLTFEIMKQTFSTSKFDSLVNPQSNKVVRTLVA
jgi:hypothetical protein